MGASFGWILQLAGMGVVGSALLVGVFQDALRAEVVMLAVGSGLFLLGRRLEKSG